LCLWKNKNWVTSLLGDFLCAVFWK
jgi:hypothetical protein